MISLQKYTPSKQKLTQQTHSDGNIIVDKHEGGNGASEIFVVHGSEIEVQKNIVT